MQIFILGNSNSDKSAVSNKISKMFDIPVYEFNGWIRNSIKTKNPSYFDLDEFEIEQLKSYKRLSMYHYDIFLYNNSTSNVIVCGIRNPDDFNSILDYDNTNIVYFVDNNINDNISLDVGLDAIKYYIKWENCIFNKIKLASSESELISIIKEML